MSAEQFVVDGTDEFIREGGFVTIEFATSPDTLLRIQPLLDSENDRLGRATLKYKGRWESHVCETCAGYNPDTDCHVHVSIEHVEGV